MAFKKFLPWFFVLLLIPYGCFIWSNTPSKGNYKPKCSEYAAKLSKRHVVVAIAEEPAKKQKSKNDEKIKLEKSVECSDLHAQWAMADITFWAFGAGIPAIILVFWTLLATKRGVQISKQAAMDQLRAYIDIDIGKTSLIIANQPITVEIGITNTGQTPAYKCSFGERIGVDTCKVADLSAEKASAILGPQRDRIVVAYSGSLSRYETNRIFNGTATLLLCFAASFVDAFGRNWVIRAKLHYNTTLECWHYREMTETKVKEDNPKELWTIEKE